MAQTRGKEGDKYYKSLTNAPDLTDGNMQPRETTWMEKELIKDLRRCTETRADLLEALELMTKSPKDMLDYCKANNLLPDPVTVEASVDEYWREAIARQAIEKAK